MAWWMRPKASKSNPMSGPKMPIDTSGRRRKPLHAAILALAGAGSFGFAALWSTSAADDSEDLLAPAVTSRAAAASPVVAVAAERPLPPSDPLTLTAGAERASNSTVVRNPFGSLNLLAETELATGRSPQTRPRLVATSTKTPKAVVEPPPPIIEAPPPPPPTAPSLPFAVVGGINGKQIADGKPVAFLRQRDDVIIVRPGDLIAETYRVESITTDRIEFTYLPLNQRQTLAMRP